MRGDIGNERKREGVVVSETGRQIILDSSA